MIRCLGMVDHSGTKKHLYPKDPMADETFNAWEADVTIPEVYDPPQNSCRYWKGKKCSPPVSCCATELLHGCFFCPLRSPAPCCVPCCRCVCCSGVGIQYGSIHCPDKWFTEMLKRSHPNCPDQLKGIWWMMDNVAAEGLFTLQDGDWVNKKLVKKSTKYNWTFDACNSWGAWLTMFMWIRGGDLRFQVSPSGKWLQITMIGQDQHFAYMVQPGDKMSWPDGSDMGLVPGDDMLRLTFPSRDDKSSVAYMYLCRRVAYLDEGGNLVKTKYYDDFASSAMKSDCCIRPKVAHHISSLQAFTLAAMPKEGMSVDPERVGSELPPEQQSMV